jgi:hypothetical protein
MALSAKKGYSPIMTTMQPSQSNSLSSRSSREAEEGRQPKREGRKSLQLNFSKNPSKGKEA